MIFFFWADPPPLNFIFQKCYKWLEKDFKTCFFCDNREASIKNKKKMLSFLNWGGSPPHPWGKKYLMYFFSETRSLFGRFLKKSVFSP